MAMDGWDIALLAVAGYIALTALARLMLRRRDELIDEFRSRMESGREEAESDQESGRVARP